MSKFISAFALLALVMASVSSSNAMDVRRAGTRAAGTKTQVKMQVEVGADPSKPRTALDILFVIDDSGSMSQHQANLMRNVDAMVQAAASSGTDIHAGVITTTMETPYIPAPWRGELAGTSKKFASSFEGDFESVLKQNLATAMSTNGAGEELPFAAIQAALSEPLASGVNQGFRRPGAGLAIFVLTDTDDQSKVAVSDFVQFLKNVAGSAPVTLHAAYVPTSDNTCERSGEIQPLRLEEAMKSLGTLQESFSLCDVDFGKKLKSIGAGYEVIGLRTVQLKLQPESLATMTVTYGSEVFVRGDSQYGWTYDSSKMQLTLGEKIDWFSQPAGTYLEIEYFTK